MKLLRKLWSFLKKPKVYATLLALASSILVWRAMKHLPASVKLSAFLTALNTGRVSEIIDYGDLVKFKQLDGTWQRTDVSVVDKADLLKIISSTGVDYSSSSQLTKLMSFLHLSAGALAVLLIYWLNSKGTNKNKALRHTTGVTFNDIGGNGQAKQALMEIIDYFKNPERYFKLGATLPRGVLLYGPPGTGKTMLAKAVATEANVNFIQTVGSEFIEMYVGVGARRVRDMFEQARAKSPCILFIDEIDAIGMKRSASSDRSNTEYVSTLDQLLAEMDGFSPSDRIVVIAATNRHTLLDEAILRSGRFSRKISVFLPDKETRLHILNINLASRAHKIDSNTIEIVATGTEDSSGADINHIVNESSFIALRNTHSYIHNEDLIEAFQKFKETKLCFKAECIKESLGSTFKF
jgi:cell division protease FtsH